MSAEPVLLIGIASEPPIAMTAAALGALGVPHLVLNQRRFAEIEAAFGVQRGAVTGVLSYAGVDLPLEGFGGLYSRMMSFSQLPEIEAPAADDALWRHAERLHRVLSEWSEVMPGRFVNPLRAQSSNGSKTYQAQLIAPFFDVPETLVTNEPEEALAFCVEHERVVYKSISSARSIVQELTGADVARLDRLVACPVQFQRYVDGVDVRVHTLASGRVFATEVSSDATDYRYASREAGHEATLVECELPEEVAKRCLALAASLELGFAGIDLRRTPDGRLVCFEVNPSPAFSFYEHSTGQPIAAALAAYLAGIDEPG